MSQLLRNLQNRRIGQWAVAYIAGAWVLLQVLDLLTNTYDLSHVYMRIAPILLAIGLVAVLILAWYHGERGAQRVSTPELLMLATLFLIAGVAVALFARSSARPARATGPAPSAAVAHASVAVLPFRNFSSDKEQEYFSDGITEEILNSLAQINGLQVAARTSSFAFKDKDVPIDSIGTRLHVAHILEGSVRIAGSRLRITAQLINAQTGFHMWSETFDRDARDVFAVQSEIARAVASELKVALTEMPHSAHELPAPVSEEAHNEYLLGLFYWNKRTSGDVLRALQHFERATQLQPDYAAAFAGLANTWGIAPVWVDTVNGVAALAKAKTAAERAITLDPDLPEAHVAVGWVKATADYDWAAADEHLTRAVELNPNYATAFQWHGETYYGRAPEMAVDMMRRAVRADPLSKIAQLQLANAVFNTNRLTEAAAEYEKTIALDSTWINSYRNLAFVYAAMKDSARAISAMQRGAHNSGQNMTAEIAIIRGAFNPNLRNQAILEARKVPNTVRAVMFFGFLGDRDDALGAFETAIRTRHTDEPRLVYFPGLAQWRKDARFIAAVKSMKLTPP